MINLITPLDALVDNGWTQYKNWDVAYERADIKDVRRRTRALQNCCLRMETVRERAKVNDLEGKIDKVLGSGSRIAGKLQVESYEEKLLANKETQ